MLRPKAIVLSLMLLLIAAAPAMADEVLTVAADSTLAGQAGWVVHSTPSNGSGASIFLYEDASKLRFGANREYGSQEWNIVPTAQYFVPTAPMNVGDTWTSLATDEGDETVAEVVSEETITTAAGTFDCLRVDVEMVSNPGVVLESYWFAWGVGFVRNEGFEAGVSDWRDEVSSYTIVGGTGYMPAAVGNTWTLEEIVVPNDGGSWGELKSLYR